MAVKIFNGRLLCQCVNRVANGILSIIMASGLTLIIGMPSILLYYSCRAWPGCPV